MSRFIAAVVLVLSGATASVADQSVTPADSPLTKFRGVVALCGRTDSASVIACASYISGFVQGSIATQGALVEEAVADQVIQGKVIPTDQGIDAALVKAVKSLPKLFCIEAPWTAGYVRAVVAQYAREHPDALNDAPDVHMLNIFAKAFPCARS